MVFITTQAIAAEIQRQQSLAREIATEQTKISSGKKYSVPSDSPQDWVQISEVGRQQSINAAWRGNLTFAQSRASQANSSLNDLNTQMARVAELIVQAASTSDGSPGQEAIARDLEGIRTTVADILNQTDYQGTPVFDDGNTVNVPIGRGLTVEAVGTRQSVSEGVATAAGPRSLDQILKTVIDAVRSGDAADRDIALGQARKGLDHVIVAQSIQGVRGQRLDDVNGRLIDVSLQLNERRSNLEDTDLTESISKLQTKLTTLEAAQSAFARINRQSLFDLLN
jgi:flagellar hook-associated protein 3 FlgL